MIGPYARLRPDSFLSDTVRVGNFVESKNPRSARHEGAASCLSGRRHHWKKVNIGAGVITCNYDGEKKHPTVIEDGAFVGTDSQLIAPVTIGKNAYVAAGSVRHGRCSGRVPRHRPGPPDQ